MTIEFVVAWLSLLPIAATVDALLKPATKRWLTAKLRAARVSDSAAFVSRVLDRIFGPRLFSWRAVGTVTFITTGLCVALYGLTYAFSPGGRAAIDESIANAGIGQGFAIALLLAGTVLSDFLSYAQTRLFVRAADRSNNLAVAWVFTISDIFVSVVLFILSFAAASLVVVYLYAAQNLETAKLGTDRYSIKLANELAGVDFSKLDADALTAKLDDGIEYAYLALPALIADVDSGRTEVDPKTLDTVRYASRIGFSWDDAPGGRKRLPIRAPDFYSTVWTVECKAADNFVMAGMSPYFYELNSANWLTLLAARGTKGPRGQTVSVVDRALVPSEFASRLSDTKRLFDPPNAAAAVTKVLEGKGTESCIRVVKIEERYSIGQHILKMPIADLYVAMARQAVIADLDSVASRFQIYTNFELSKEIVPLLANTATFRMYGEAEDSPSQAQMLDWAYLSAHIDESMREPGEKLELPKLYLPFSTLAVVSLFPSAIFLFAMMARALAVSANHVLEFARNHSQHFLVDKYPISVLAVTVVAAGLILSIGLNAIF